VCPFEDIVKIGRNVGGRVEVDQVVFRFGRPVDNCVQMSRQVAVIYADVCLRQVEMQDEV